MSDDLIIVLTAGLIATACGLLGPFLVLRRAALLADAVSHAVLPGIVAVWLIAHTRAPLPVVAGAAAFAVLCVLVIDRLTTAGLGSDAAIAVVFPALFSLGVLGVTRYADGVHLDLDSTIYGEIAFVPFDTIAGTTLVRATTTIAVVVVVDLVLVVALWKELKATTFDPAFSRVAGLRPTLLSRLLLVAVAVTAVASFEAVGAILVVSLLIVPACTAYLVVGGVRAMVVTAVGAGWVAAAGGYWVALAADSSIAGSMGLVCAGMFAVAMLAAPRRGLIPTVVRRLRHAHTAHGER